MGIQELGCWATTTTTSVYNTEREEMKKMVNVIESTLIVPCEETPRGKLSLSNLEQVAPSFYTCTLFFYKNNGAASDDVFFSIEVMKAALAKTLVLFYPLAGRFMIGTDGRRVIDCNAEGALFVVARSERSSDDIDFQPSPELRNQFVPKAASSSVMIMLQVTYLKCGGVVLGIANNHVLVDGRSAFHYLRTWASIARGECTNNIVPPCFDYSLIRARSPPKINFDYPDYEIDDQVKNISTKSLSSCVTTKLKLSNEQISFLKSRCNEGNTKSSKVVSTFCVISALVWKCYCIAQELPPGTETRFHFTADIRKRFSPPLPDNFFGNTVIRTFASAEVTKVTSDPVYVAASAVKKAADGLTDEYVRSFIDYVEVNEDKKLSLVLDLPTSDLRISSITGMPVYEVDFGWSAPQLMTWAEAPGTNIIYIINEPENAGVSVYVWLDSSTMHKFKKAFHDEVDIPRLSVDVE